MSATSTALAGRPERSAASTSLAVTMEGTEEDRAMVNGEMK